jgi:cap1 methyltransferase
MPPFYFSPNAVHFAALDSLVEFTNKPDMGQTMKIVDLAGAPSEFTHYLYWKRQRMVKGWGMVRVDNPKLGAGRVVDQIAPWESFQVLGPHSGVNVCDTNSIKSLCAGVENYSPGGVHLLIGDSTPLHHGPHPPGYAETLTKQQLLAQCICACRVLQLGGMFICRVYEFFSRFSASLAYLMYRCFEEVVIVKPMTSCPTSPERFLVCKGFAGCKSILTEMLLEVNSHISELSASVNAKQDVLEIVPIQLLLGGELCGSHNGLIISASVISQYKHRVVYRLTAEQFLLKRIFIEQSQ